MLPPAKSQGAANNLVWVQIVLRAPQWREFNEYGVTPDFFNDPGRQFLAFEDTVSTGASNVEPDWVHAYQYFAGIEFWTNVQGRLRSRSPISLDDMSPEMAMTADALMRINGVWGGNVQAGAYEDIPPHFNHGRAEPRGGNQTFADGSGSFHELQGMQVFSTWNVGGARDTHWFQQDVGDFVLPTP